MHSSTANIMLAKQAKGGDCRSNLTRLWSSEVAILAAALSSTTLSSRTLSRTQQAETEEYSE